MGRDYLVWDNGKGNFYSVEVNPNRESVINKMSLLGMQAEYICNDEMTKLERYAGHSKKLDLADCFIAICDSSFQYNAELESIKMNEYLAAIEVCSFYGCSNLTTVKLNDRIIDIGYSAFKKCNLTEIVIPKSVVLLASDTFSCNKNLRDIYIESYNIDYEIDRRSCNTAYLGDAAVRLHFHKDREKEISSQRHKHCLSEGIDNTYAVIAPLMTVQRGGGATDFEVLFDI